MFSGTRKRLITAASKKAPTSTRVFAALEVFCFFVSVLTLTVAPCLIFAKRLDIAELTPCLLGFYKVTLAGSVGFLTNWLAIQMLFKPYEPQKLLVLWRQGLIPRNKKKIAAQVGETVVAQLLDPNEIAARLSALIERQTRATDTKREIVRELFTFWQDHEKKIIETVTPELVDAAVQLIKRNVTPERAKEIWNEVVVPRLQNEENLRFLASRVVEGMKTRVPELVDVLRDGLRGYMREYLRQKAPFLSVGGELLVEGLVLFVDWDSIERAIRRKLEEEETFEKIENALEDGALDLQRWFDSQEGREELERRLITFINNFALKIRDYLRTETPRLLNAVSNSPRISHWVEQTLLPSLVPWLKNKIVEQTPKILEEINVSQIVEVAIDRQDVHKFHKMVDDVAAESMGAIQVLGFFLGAAVGVLLIGI